MGDKTITTSATAGKLQFLEGIRGLMALNVVVNHFVVIFFPQMFFREYAQSMGGTLSLFASTPLAIFVSGGIAVQYFFVLTGLLVGRSIILHPPAPGKAADKLVRRYLRLLPVMAVSTLLAAALGVLGLYRDQQAVGLVLNSDFLAGSAVVELSVKGVLMNLFINPFLYGYSEYVGPFWTIRYEFFGYLLSLAICLIFRECPWRKLGYLLCGALCFAQLEDRYLGFILGVFIADLFFNDSPDCFEKFYRRWIHSRFFLAVVTLAGTYFACCPGYFTGIYFFWGYVPKVTPDIVQMLGATMLVYAVLHMPRVQDFLSARFLVWLGKLSFGIYGLHMSVLLSLCCGLFTLLLPAMGYVSAALTAFAISIVAIVALAWLTWRLVEKSRR